MSLLEKTEKQTVGMVEVLKVNIELLTLMPNYWIANVELLMLNY